MPSKASRTATIKVAAISHSQGEEKVKAVEAAAAFEELGLTGELINSPPVKKGGKECT